MFILGDVAQQGAGAMSPVWKQNDKIGRYVERIRSREVPSVFGLVWFDSDQAASVCFARPSSSDPRLALSALRAGFGKSPIIKRRSNWKVRESFKLS